jgi:hypothetical protein
MSVQVKDVGVKETQTRALLRRSQAPYLRATPTFDLQRRVRSTPIVGYNKKRKLTKWSLMFLRSPVVRSHITSSYLPKISPAEFLAATVFLIHSLLEICVSLETVGDTYRELEVCETYLLVNLNCLQVYLHVPVFLYSSIYASRMVRAQSLLIGILTKESCSQWKSLDRRRSTRSQAFHDQSSYLP